VNNSGTLVIVLLNKCEQIMHFGNSTTLVLVSLDCSLGLDVNKSGTLEIVLQHQCEEIRLF
jgi:hypothetical protein